MYGKDFLTSKTFWANVLTVIVAALGALLGSEQIKDNPQLVTIFTAAVGIVNILLRAITDQPITSWFGWRR